MATNQRATRFQRCAGALLSVGLGLACSTTASNKASTKDTPAQNAAAAKNASAAERRALSPEGKSLAQPASVCGPQESYQYVAEEFRCPDGENPLNGDLEKAQGARVGSLDHPENGHIVDVYRVECEPEPVDVFVDMYGCEEYAEQLDSTAPSAPLQQLLERYEEDDFAAVIDQCGKDADQLEPDESMGCMVLVPASFFGVGNPSGAVHVLREMCNRMPPPSSLSNARANLVMQVTSAVAHTAERNGEEISTEDGAAIVSAFAEACEVTPEDLERALSRAQTL